MKNSGRIGLMLAAGAIAALALLCAYYFGARYYFRTNLVPVVQNRVYRSGQPDRKLLARGKDRGIAAVINLRGDNSGSRWYEEEVRAADSLGLVLHNIEIAGRDWPPRIEVQKLTALLEEARSPVLLHCADGLDRSGWAAGVALALEGAPMNRVLDELSRRKGHFCFVDRCYMHRFYREYEEWLARNQRVHGAAVFREWINDYAPLQYKASIQLLNQAPATVSRGDLVEIPFEVTNRSHLPWRTAGLEQRVKGGARILGPFEKLPADPIPLFRVANGPARDLARVEFDRAEIRPGERVRATLQFHAPSEPGRYWVQIDLVEEKVQWFSDLGEPGIAILIEVT